MNAIDSARDGRGSSGGYYRWIICLLLFFATTINYVDRSVLSVLEPELKKIIHWTPAQFGYVNAAFTLAYAIGFLFAGWMMDRIGVRWGYAISLVLWSLAAASHCFASTIWGFAIARFALGLGESGNFPAAIKTVAEWFPRKERAFATGLFNSGSNIGAIIAPLIVPAILVWKGWSASFIATGLIGIVWVFFWLPLYRPPRQHPRLSPQELAYIESDPADPPQRVPWAKLLPFRQTWAFAAGKFLTDSVWWFYVFWLGKFMNEQFKVDIKGIGPPMITVFLLADVGSIAGGWLSSRLLAGGWSANAARKTVMLICAVCVVPVAMAPLVKNPWTAVLLIGLASAAHQGFSANLFTFTSDMFPRHAVGSVVGIGGFAGAMGGFFTQMLAGNVMKLSDDLFGAKSAATQIGAEVVEKHSGGSYIAVFALAAVSYLLALFIIHMLVPRLEPVQLSEK